MSFGQWIMEREHENKQLSGLPGLPDGDLTQLLTYRVRGSDMWWELRLELQELQLEQSELRLFQHLARMQDTSHLTQDTPG